MGRSSPLMSPGALACGHALVLRARSLSSLVGQHDEDVKRPLQALFARPACCN